MSSFLYFFEGQNKSLLHNAWASTLLHLLWSDRDIGQQTLNKVHVGSWPQTPQTGLTRPVNPDCTVWVNWYWIRIWFNEFKLWTIWWNEQWMVGRRCQRLHQNISESVENLSTYKTKLSRNQCALVAMSCVVDLIRLWTLEKWWFFCHGTVDQCRRGKC